HAKPSSTCRRRKGQRRDRARWPRRRFRPHPTGPPPAPRRSAGPPPSPAPPDLAAGLSLMEWQGQGSCRDIGFRAAVLSLRHQDGKPRQSEAMPRIAVRHGRFTTPYIHRMEINPLTISQPERYKLLIGCIVPRPIAFVSTVSPDG